MSEYNFWKSDAKVGLMLYGYQPQEGYIVPYFFKVKIALNLSEDEVRSQIYSKLYGFYARFAEMAKDNYEDPSFIYLQNVNTTPLSDTEIADKIWLSAKAASWEDSNCFVIDEHGTNGIDLNSF